MCSAGTGYIWLMRGLFVGLALTLLARGRPHAAGPHRISFSRCPAFSWPAGLTLRLYGSSPSCFFSLICCSSGLLAFGLRPRLWPRKRFVRGSQTSKT